MEYRIEHDTMGEIRVPADKYWGAQTQRSLENFQIGRERMPLEVLYSLAVVKKASAMANCRLGVLSQEKKELICQVCDEILEGQLNDHFPLVVWQTGSGTQSNMNVNEVVAGRANEKAGVNVIHPNDDVNKSQSSNDTYPAAMHMAAVKILEDRLLPAARDLEEILWKLSAEHNDLVKTGRTHLQDATPITLGQEIGAWAQMVKRSREMVVASMEGLRELALGGTAVGTGLNAPEGFDTLVAEQVSELTGKQFITAENKFHSLSARDAMSFCHGALKTLAADLMKIANDVRWLASGPRCGIGEIFIPENEPGSSIMPGKVNPTQCEALTMIAVRVIGNDVTIGMAASQGNFQLNVYMPVMAYSFLQSAELLADGMDSFRKNCIAGLQPNEVCIRQNLEKSLMLVTALNPHIGYENAAKVAKLAHQQGITLEEAVVSLGFMTGEEFRKAVDPLKMVGKRS